MGCDLWIEGLLLCKLIPLQTHGMGKCYLGKRFHYPKSYNGSAKFTADAPGYLITNLKGVGTWNCLHLNWFYRGLVNIYEKDGRSGINRGSWNGFSIFPSSSCWYYGSADGVFGPFEGKHIVAESFWQSPVFLWSSLFLARTVRAEQRGVQPTLYYCKIRPSVVVTVSLPGNERSCSAACCMPDARSRDFHTHHRRCALISFPWYDLGSSSV